MTLEELKALPMEYTFGYTAHDHAVRQYQNSDQKICKQVYTPRHPSTGEWGKGVATFMLTETKQEFDNIDDLLAAINARVKNDCGGAYHHRYAGSFGG